jgi:renalase
MVTDSGQLGYCAGNPGYPDTRNNLLYDTPVLITHQATKIAMKSVAIIGAGLSGLTLANRLQNRAEVTVFEKSGGFGGRMATRRSGAYQFDHGAQYFTARSTEFRQFLLDHSDAGLLHDWQPRTLTLGGEQKPYTRPWFEPHWIAAPGMNSLGKSLARNQRVELNAEVTAVCSAAGGWLINLQSGEQRGPFDWFISTAPAPQTSKLMPADFLHTEALNKLQLSGCFSLMLGYQSPLNLSFQAAKVKDSPIGWLALDSSKPGRDSNPSLLAQSTNHWADDHLDEPVKEVQRLLLDELGRLLPQLPEPDHADLHRWRYAAASTPLQQDFLLDEQRQLAACGDWCLGARVEAAFTSANRLAARLTDLLG